MRSVSTQYPASKTPAVAKAGSQASTASAHYLHDVEKDLCKLARLLAGMASTVSTVADEFLTEDLLVAIATVRAMEHRLDGYRTGAYAPPPRRGGTDR